MRSNGTGAPHTSWLHSAAVILAALIVAAALFVSRMDEDEPDGRTIVEMRERFRDSRSRRRCRRAT